MAYCRCDSHLCDLHDVLPHCVVPLTVDSLQSWPYPQHIQPYSNHFDKLTCYVIVSNKKLPFAGFCVIVIWRWVFRSTVGKSRRNKADLRCSSVHTYVCTSIHKNFFDFKEIWHVGRDQWVMHDDMQYDPIQGQGQGHEPLKVENPSIFKSYLFCHLQCELATDHWFLN